MPQGFIGNSEDEVLEKVHDRLNYEGIHSFMEDQDWKWVSEEMEVPSEKAIKCKVEDLVRKSIREEFYYLYTGGFLILNHTASDSNSEKLNIEVIFNIAGWF